MSCQLSLAIPLWVGAMSIIQWAVTLCGSGVKVCIARNWWQVSYMNLRWYEWAPYKSLIARQSAYFPVLFISIISQYSVHCRSRMVSWYVVAKKMMLRVKPGHGLTWGTRSVPQESVACSQRQCVPAFRCPNPTTTAYYVFLLHQFLSIM